MNLRTTFIVPDFGRYVCDQGIELASSKWSKGWRRPRRSNGQGDYLFGQHVYFCYPKKLDGTIDTTLTFCKVRWNNGTVNPDGTGFRGKVYFDSLSVTISDRTDVSIVTIPTKGESITGTMASYCVWTLTARGTHVFLPRWIIEREFVVCPRGREADALQVLRREGNYAPAIPAKVVDYGPLLVTQPTGVDRAAYNGARTSQAEVVEAAIANGTPAYLTDILDLEGPNLGPFHPNGAKTAYSQGGLDIDPCTGFEQCPAALRLNSLIHRLEMDRAPMALYHADTGEVLRMDEWTSYTLGHGQLLKGEPGHEGDINLPAFITGTYPNYSYPVLNPGHACAYEAALWQYYCPDAAHSRRLSVNAEPLAHYEHCPMAIDDVALAFEWCRHEGNFSNRDDEYMGPGWHAPSLTEAHLHSTLTPGQGWSYDRSFAWTMWHAAFVWRYLDGPLAMAAMDWILMAQETYVSASDPVTRLLQRESHPGYLPPSIQGTQSFHSALLAIGLAATQRMSGGPSSWDPSGGLIGRTLAGFVRAFYGSQTLQLVDDPYGGVSFGPPHWVWTWQQVIGAPPGTPPWAPIRPLDNAHASADGDPVHVLAAIAAAWLVTGDDTLLSLGLRVMTPHPDLPSMYAWLRSLPLEMRAQTASFESALEQVLAT